MPCPHMVLKPSLCRNSTPQSLPSRDRLGGDRAVHVGVTARLPHEPAAQGVEVLLGVATLVEHGGAGDRREAVDDHPQRLAGGMDVDGPRRA